MTRQISSTVAQLTDSTVLVATYLECFPTATNEVATRLKQEREATRGDPGLTWCEFLQRLDRPGQFMALSAWSTEQALETHRRTRHVVDLNQTLAPVLAAPSDSRHHQRFAH